MYSVMLYYKKCNMHGILKLESLELISLPKPEKLQNLMTVKTRTKI